jgi:hypothetical protein
VSNLPAEMEVNESLLPNEHVTATLCAAYSQFIWGKEAENEAKT